MQKKGGRGRGRGRGGSVASPRNPKSTPVDPYSSRPAIYSTPSSSGKNLPQQYTITPPSNTTPPPLVQTKLTVRDYPPPAALFQTASPPQMTHQRPRSSSSPGDIPLHEDSQNGHRQRPIGRSFLSSLPQSSQRQSSSNPIGQRSPPTNSPVHHSEVHSNRASEAQHSNDTEDEDEEAEDFVEMEVSDGVDDSANNQPTLPEDQLRYLESMLMIPGRGDWTTVLSPIKPQPIDTTW